MDKQIERDRTLLQGFNIFSNLPRKKRWKRGIFCDINGKYFSWAEEGEIFFVRNICLCYVGIESLHQFS